MVKKKFIDKKQATIYSVVHRSQQDGAYGVEERPSEFVLVAQRRDMVTELGLPNDGYDYTQHLRMMDGTGMFVSPDGATMPSSAMALPREVLPQDEVASRQTEAIALDPTLMDPELRSALFEEVGDFDELNDDFVVKASTWDEESDFDYDAHIAHLIAAASIKEAPDLDSSAGEALEVDEAFEAALAEYDENDEETGKHRIELLDRAQFFDDMLAETLDAEHSQLQAQGLDPALRRRILETEENEVENPDGDLEHEFNAITRERDERDSRINCDSANLGFSNLDNRPTILSDDAPRSFTTRQEEAPLSAHSEHIVPQGEKIPTPPKYKKYEDTAAKADRKAKVKADKRLARARKKELKLSWAHQSHGGRAHAQAAKSPSVFSYSN